MSTVLLFNNREYVSSRDAAVYSGYTIDYISKLCRLQKIQGKLVGKIWYVEKVSLDTFLGNQERAKVEIQKKLSEDRKADYRSQVFTRTVETVIEVAPPKGAEFFKTFAKGLAGAAVIILIVGGGISIANNGVSPLMNAGKSVAIGTLENGIHAGSFASNSIPNSIEFFESSSAATIEAIGNSISAFGKNINAIAMRIHDSAIAYVNSVFGKVAVRPDHHISEAPNVPAQETPSSNENEGMVVVPGTGEQHADAAKISKIQQTFSDEVSVIPSVDGKSGIIRPVFKDTKADDYLYVLVPIGENNSQKGQ
jgi:hypothetical protein